MHFNSKGAIFENQKCGKIFAFCTSDLQFVFIPITVSKLMEMI